MTPDESITTIHLRHGALRFTARAAGAGPLVLLLHGFPDSEHSFDAQLPALAAAGYRAVAPRLRGYEPSSQPADDNYHAVRMAEDVLAWIDEAGEQRVHLIGHDWGAIIAQAAVALAPDRFFSLAILAVPRLIPFGKLVRSDRAQFRRSLYGLFFQWRGIADRYVSLRKYRFLERLWRRWSPGWAIPACSLARMKAVFAEPGVVRAALSYYRQSRDHASPAGHRTAQLLRKPLRVPTLGLYGAEDGCIGADIFKKAMPPTDFTAGLRLEKIDGAGHFFHRERPDAVNAILIDWLSAGPGPSGGLESVK